MTRKNRPYLFYDTTSSVCSTCLRVVEAKIVVQGHERVHGQVVPGARHAARAGLR